MSISINFFFPVQVVLAMKPFFMKINISEFSLWVRINLFQCLHLFFFRIYNWLYVFYLCFAFYAGDLTVIIYCKRNFHEPACPFQLQNPTFVYFIIPMFPLRGKHMCKRSFWKRIFLQFLCESPNKYITFANKIV